MSLIISVVILVQILSLYPASSQSSTCVNFDSITHRITVSCGSFRISDLASNLANKTAIKIESSGIWILDADLIVNQGSTVIIDSKDVKWLKITTPHGINVLGNLVVDSVRITGWDSTAKTFSISDGQKPRPYLNMAVGSTGQMNITNSEIAYMGYLQDGRQGISYSGGSGSRVANNNIHDMLFGFYSNNVSKMIIEYNIIHDNIGYGLDPHSGTNNMIIRSNQVYNIGKTAGITCSFNCSNILIEDNTVYNVTGIGIMLNHFTTNSTIRNNNIHDSGIGISISDNSGDIGVYNNMISNTPKAINLELNSSSNAIVNNIIANSTVFGICQDESSQSNTILPNKITGSPSPICTQNSTQNLILSSTLTGNQSSKIRIGMVNPSFTYAAYNYGHFYNFYAKYGFPPAGTLITTDLNMLTSAPLTHGAFHFFSDPKGEAEIPGGVFFRLSHDYVSKVLPEAQVDDLQDEDVDAGKIFDSKGKNMYDVLFLYHQEYVTAVEYQNFETFVTNGGIIIFADSNYFTVEVTYSKETDSITFVQGHNWQFDGKIAQPGPAERWINETSVWTGSNFLQDPVQIPITFRKMPFNYTHTEEQYISNSKDTILLDYDARYPMHHRFNPVIAAYELSYGKGKIESLGFFAHKNPPDLNLENFIENVILPRALGNIITIHTLDQTLPVRSIMQTGQVSQISLANNTLSVHLTRSIKNDDTLRIVFPNNLLGNHPRDDLNITLDGQPVSFRHFADDVETGFEIVLPKEGSLIQISPVIPKPDLSSSIESLKKSLVFTHYYSCDLQFGDVYVCDFVPNSISAYQVHGEGLKIYSTNSTATFYTNGQKGSALELNEVRYESLEVPYSKAITPSQFSISFFVKPKEAIRNYRIIASDVNVKQDSGWYFEMVGGVSKNVYFDILLDHKIIRSRPIAISSNDFTHIAATFGDGKIRIYKNGALVDSINNAGQYNLPNALMRIGGMSWSTNVFPLNGMLDEFYFYSRVLQPKEISDIYNLSNAPHDSSLVLYYPFDGDLKDHSGNGINAVKPTLIASMEFAPDGRLFFTEKDTGNIRIMKNNTVLDEPFYHVSDTNSKFEQGLLGLTIDPKFEENHFVYFYYAYHEQGSKRIYNKVVRVVDVNNKGQDPLVILDKIYASDGFHSGGAMAFGTDDKLYITVGDATEHPFAMDPNILIGKVLRINRDGSIPYDNPYPNNPVYNMGHRNMFGIAFDHNGFGIVTENGDSFFDEVNDIQKGVNYGFPLIQPANENPYLFNSTKSVMPMVAFHTTIAPTQAIYYDGNGFPDYHGQFIFGSFDGGIFALNIDDATKTVTSYDRIFVNRDSLEPVITIAQSPSGDIYYGGYSIYKLQKIDSSKTRFIAAMEVNSTSEDAPFKEIKFLPVQRQMILTPADGNKHFTAPVAINALVTITNGVDSIEDVNGNKLNFVTQLKSPYYLLEVFVNFNGTDSALK